MMNSAAGLSTSMTALSDDLTANGSTIATEAIRTYLLQIFEGVATPTSLAFGRVNVNATPVQSITLTNNRYRPITYNAPLKSGDAGFSIAGGESCTTRVVPAQGGTCTITVTFTPGTQGDKTGAIAISFVNDGIDPQPVGRTTNLAGHGNAAPVANPGSAQNVSTAATVQLDGNGSSDADGDTLSYAWTLVAAPAGSNATLSNAAIVNPTFAADLPGTYMARLVVGDGLASSAAAFVSVTATTPNTPPVANAGTSQTVTAGAAVALNGSASSDAEHDPLSYAWSLVARPAGSVATLSSSSAPNPTFTADKAGGYVARLVVNDGHVDSAAATVAITVIAANTPPVANAGPAQGVVAGAAVVLDGSASSDAEHDSLSFTWTLTSKPTGSAASLGAATTPHPSFVAGIAGTYVVTLIVNDGQVNSPPATVTVTAAVGNAPPVANAGPAQNVLAGATTMLDGSASSDVNHDPLTFAWSLVARPAGSTAVLSSTTVDKPTFVADLAGGYSARLVVNDGHVDSSPSNVTITAANGQPAFSISNSAPSFAAVVGMSSSTSTVISNTGGTALSLTGVSFSGAASGDYSLAPTNACTLALSIAPGGSCTLIVQFQPAASGGRDATLTITDTAPGSPHNVTLAGTATPAPLGHIQVGALSVAFGDVQTGVPSSQSLAVLNNGDAPLNFSAFTLSGSAASDFSRSGNCDVAAPLAVGASCTVGVAFQPSALGARSAALLIASDASNGSVSIALSGDGVAAPAPQVGVSVTTLDFGTQTVGGLYPARTIILTNTGTADLALTSIGVDGAGFANASTSPCPPTLHAAASCHIDIAFAPTADGTAYTGTLRIASNAPGSPNGVALTGQGTVATVQVLAWSTTVTQLDFGQVSVGTVSSGQTLTLLNRGPGGVNLNLLNAVGADGAVFPVTVGTCAIGVVLFEGRTCTIDVRFAPASSGARQATLQVATTGSQPPIVTLTGTGLGGPSAGLEVSATTLAFDPTRVGAQSLPAQLSLSANGSGAVQVTAMGVTGPYLAHSTTCPATPFTLQPGSTCTVSVAFQPQAEGAAAGSLHVTSDASAAVPDVALSGIGQAAADTSSGGCSIASGDSLADPTLWALLVLALAALRYRTGARRAERRRPLDRFRGS